jgi:hypothetical protein
MKKLLMAMCLAMFMVVPALAQDEAPEREGSDRDTEAPANGEDEADGEAEGEGEADGDAESDGLKPYRTVGNTWTTRTTTSIEGMGDMVSYTKVTVTKIENDVATIEYTMMDAEQNETMKTESTVRLTPDEAEAEAEGEEPETVEETIEVEAGEFETIRQTFSQEGSTTRIWLCQKTSMVVKTETATDNMTSTTELITFEVE